MNRKRLASFWRGVGSTISLFGEPGSPLRFPKRSRTPIEEIYRDIRIVFGDMERAVSPWRDEMNEKRGEAIHHGG